jgi:hypothetical protein
MSEIRNIIMQLASQDPTYKQGIDSMEAQVQRMPIVPEDLDDAIAMLEFVLQNPDKYGEVRASAIKDGVIDPNMVPEQYDQVFVVSLLIALYGLQDRLQAKGYARGGLAVAARRIQDEGRGGDDMLAHINHREAEMLKRMGGAGTINPTTGLHEYKSIFKIFMSVLPIALSIFAPGIGTAIGGFLSGGMLTGASAAALGGGAIGALSGGVTGGWKGALMGGAAGALGGGFGGQVGSSASSALGLGLGKTGQAMLGSGLIGAGVGAAGAGMSGGNVLKGAAMGAGVGAAGGAIGSMASGIGTDSALGLAANRGGQAFGNALAAGYKPKEAAISGALAGTVAGLQFQTPAEMSAANQVKLNDINAGNKDYSLDMGKQVNVSDISMKPSDNIVNSLKLGNMAGGMNTAAGGGQYVTDPVSGAETWVPNSATSAPSYDLGTAANTFGGYNYNPTTMTNGNIYNTAVPGFGDAGVAALSTQNILGSNNSLGSEQAIYSNAPNGQGVNALGGPTGLTNTINNPNNVYGNAATQSAGLTPAQAAPQTDAGGGIDWGKAALIGGGALALGSMMSAPKDAQSAVSQLSPQQQEYFNRPSVQFDWNKIQNDANQQNRSLYQYMAENWPKISSGAYNAAGYAAGGALGNIARFARGAGSGRDDTIDAKLSDGEYVIDAETVALLGDGSNKAGAKMLDKMRSEIRAQKGKVLAKGKISPDAKSPLAYLRGAM